jgi:Protein of unknown function (DUF1559)
MSFIRWLVAPLLLIVAPVGLVAADKQPPVGFAGVQADGFGIVTVNVAQIWDLPASKPLREALSKLKDPLKSEFEKFSGLKLEEIERVTLYWPTYFKAGVQNRQAEPFKIVVLRKPFERAAMLKALKAKTSTELNDGEFEQRVTRIIGKNVVFIEETNAIIFVDERTLIFSPPLTQHDDVDDVEGLLKVLNGDTPKVTVGPLADALACAEKHSVVAAFAGAPVKNSFELTALPDVLTLEIKILQMMARAERGLFTIDFGPTIRTTAKIDFVELAEPDSKKLFGLLHPRLVDLFKSKDAYTVLLPWLDFIKVALDKAEVKLEGQSLTANASGEVDASMNKSLSALPDWANARNERLKSMKNLVQIVLAMHSYHDANNLFPQDVLDKDGKPILSWRVHLLPQLEQDALFKQMDLTKSWDDKANKKFVEQMPEVFKYYGREPKEKGFTYFQSFTSPIPLDTGSPFLVPGRNIGFQNITDGTSNTFMVVEGEVAVNWLKPGDLPYNTTKLPKLGNPKTGKFLAGMGDGSVRWLDAKKLGEPTLHGLITIDGGEVVSFDE